MNASVLIFKKEWKSLFSSPMAYVVMTLFFALMGYLFFGLITQFQLASLQYQAYPGAADDLTLNDMIIKPLYGNVCVLWLLIVPLITMRLISEERKMQTFVLLLTAPVKLSQIVMGKFLAGLAFITVLLLVSAVYPAICIAWGNAEWGPVLTANLGLWLMGAIFIAIGLLASSLTESQILAAVLGFSFILFFWIIDFLSDIGDKFHFLTELSLLTHLDSFLKGVINTYDLAFYGLFLFFILFLTHQFLKGERWR